MFPHILECTTCVQGSLPLVSMRNRLIDFWLTQKITPNLLMWIITMLIYLPVLACYLHHLQDSINQQAFIGLCFRWGKINWLMNLELSFGESDSRLSSLQAPFPYSLKWDATYSTRSAIAFAEILMKAKPNVYSRCFCSHRPCKSMWCDLTNYGRRCRAKKML